MANLSRIRERVAAGPLAILLLLCTGNPVRAQSTTNVAQSAPAPGHAASAANGDFQRVLFAELRRLRAELLEYRVEMQAVRIRELQASLEQIKARQQRLSDEERAAAQQLTSPEPQFSGLTLNPAERSQLESMKAALIAEQAERTRAEQSDLAIRESAADASLREGAQRLQTLQAALQELTAGH